MNSVAALVIFLFYGLSFFILGFVCLFLRSDRYTSSALTKNLLFLGIFGILHGLVEWLELYQKVAEVTGGNSLHPHPILTVNGASFVFLGVFGLKLNRIKVGPALAIWALVLASGLVLRSSLSSNVIIRLILGTPAAFLSGYGLLREGLGFRKSGRTSFVGPLVALAFSITSYGVAVSITRPFTLPWGLVFYPEVLRMMLTVVSSVSVVIIGFRIRSAEQELLWTLKKDEVVFRERMRLGRDLHDWVLQRLFAAGLTMDR